MSEIEMTYTDMKLIEKALEKEDQQVYGEVLSKVRAVLALREDSDEKKYYC